ncbi:MAG: GNAT family N-acetyltransferase [Bdellovibrionota bacterium]
MQIQNKSWEKENFLISTDKIFLQVDRIHKFLANDAYWSQGIPKAVVVKSIENSFCFGLYDISAGDKEQIGYARIVTDYASFAWLCDVYVEPSHRNKGLSKWLMTCVMSHPDLQNLRRICLATKDAHELYKKFGFEVTKSPENWMEIKDNDLYKKMKLLER